jgi:hypothetical protein
MQQYKRAHTSATVAVSMRRVLVMAVGMLGNIAKVQVSKFIPAVVTGMRWRGFLVTHTRGDQTPG